MRRFALLTACLLTATAGDALSASGPPLPHFADRTTDSGIEIVTYSGGAEKSHILESTGNGILVLDYDLDGDQDLYFAAAYRLPRSPERGERGALYQNAGDATFTDTTERAGVAARGVYAHGGAVGDADGDGWPDLYLTAVGPNVLYRNNGDGTFTDRTEEAGVGDPGPSVGATFFDADGDGDNDLYVANYVDATWEEILTARRTRKWQGKVLVMDGPRGLAEGRSTFYRNEGDGHFRDATEEAGFADGGTGYFLGVASFDYDNDGDADVYVANDSGPNRLYRNRGDGTFEEVGTLTGCAYNGDGRLQGSMGVGFGDFDGDGWFDLAVTNFAHDHYVLYHNLGGQLFDDVSFPTHLAEPTFRPLGWAALAFDADNDADLDLFFSNGHIYPQVDEDPTLYESYRQRNQLLINDGGKLRDASEEAGPALALQHSSRGAVYADLDDDGDLDVVVSNQDERADLLLNVTEPGRRWMTLRLDGVLGARLEVVAGGRLQIRETTSGGSYASQNDPRLHVGLGEEERADATVTWPGGRRTTFLSLAAGRFYVLRRP